ncbi:MAG: class B sortase [Ruminococcus sp.]|nr:class B sortase [Ruminococcus sp.]MCD7801217.1 class B sortase [Ruminococcus sp.]
MASATAKGKSKKKKKKTTLKDILRELFPCAEDSFAEGLRKIVFLISVIIFGVCVYLVFDYFYQNYKNDKMYEQLYAGLQPYVETVDDAEVTTTPDDEGYIQAPTTETEVVDGETRTIYINSPEADYWISQNSDYVGSIYIDGTRIDYPIVQKTTEEEKEFYLTHNFLGQEAKAGSIFLDYRCIMGGDSQSTNMVIYGHNMQDESMFGQLKKYKDEEGYYEEHPIIQISSRYETSLYKIFSVFIENVDPDNEEQFQYYNKIAFNSEDEFYDYANNCKMRSLISNDVDVTYGDKLVTLSTCTSNYLFGSSGDGRLVVVARRVRAGEDVYEGTEGATFNPDPLMPSLWYELKGGSYDGSSFVPFN